MDPRTLSSAPRASTRFVELHALDPQATAAELDASLRADDAWIAPKFFYDPLGSRLFSAITQLDEYTPTRTEAAIFAAHRHEIAAAIGPGVTLIDLGAGDCAKAAALFDVLAPAQYVAVDVSVEYLRDALVALAQQHPGIDMLGLGLDFSRALALPLSVRRARRLVFFPGSSIGNFTQDDALRFIGEIRAQCDQGVGLLIGVDLVKDAAVLEAAYDDALGVTAAFNRNVLRHVNRVLGSDFDVAQWRHVALWNAPASRIEMHLEALVDLEVHWRFETTPRVRAFRRGERILTEVSTKYRPDAFARLLLDAGFARTRAWTDPHHGFAVFLAQVS